jgi:hypothetical protein
MHMQMRRTLMAGAAAAAALVTAVSMATTASAATAVTHDVLTITKAKGTNVKVGAVLKASLKPKTSAKFVSGGITVTCTKSSFTAKVTSNPRSPGTARESLTAQTATSCKLSGLPGVSVKSVVVKKLPYKTTVSSAKNHPVTVANASTTLNLKAGTSTISCTFGAKKLSGKASNTGQVISFTKQGFKLTGGNALCGTPGKTTGSFTATYGPVRDTSVKGSPKVFVN